jgi:hypothetical protein
LTKSMLPSSRWEQHLLQSGSENRTFTYRKIWLLDVFSSSNWMLGPFEYQRNYLSGSLPLDYRSKNLMVASKPFNFQTGNQMYKRLFGFYSSLVHSVRFLNGPVIKYLSLSTGYWTGPILWSTLYLIL